MGRILYFVDPGSNSNAFIIEPDVTEEENEVNKRRIEVAAKKCARQAYEEFLEQKEIGIDQWEAYFNQQLLKYPTKKNVVLEEVTEEEMNKIIFG